MSDPFQTLTEHLHANHVALRNLFERALELVMEGRPRRSLLPGLADAVTALRAHHRYEDELLIPRVRDHNPEVWDAASAEHRVLDAALSTLESATEHGPVDLSDLEPALQAIASVLPDHFEAEEQALGEGVWRSIFDDDLEQARAFGKATAAHNREGLSPGTRLLPLILYNLPPDERRRFTARMPGFLVNGLVPYAFRPAWRSRRAFMRFAPRRLTPALWR